MVSVVFYNVMLCVEATEITKSGIILYERHLEEHTGEHRCVARMKLGTKDFFPQNKALKYESQCHSLHSPKLVSYYMQSLSIRSVLFSMLFH